MSLETSFIFPPPTGEFVRILLVRRSTAFAEIRGNATSGMAVSQLIHSWLNELTEKIGLALDWLGPPPHVRVPRAGA
jgi:hypothetical protein